MEKELIAPCGMNCTLCYAYQREKNKCGGCRNDKSTVANSCIRCVIRNCETIKENTSHFCYDCIRYPCRRLKELDKRYRGKYHMSMIDNLALIKSHGLDVFIDTQYERFRCVNCGSILCVHHKNCSVCNCEIVFKD